MAGGSRQLTASIERDFKRLWLGRSSAALLCCVALALSACHKASPTAETMDTDPDEVGANATHAKETAATTANSKEPDEGVSLSPDEVAKMGLLVQPVRAIRYTAETQGFGVITLHESIATAVAELAVAEAAESQSRAALTRSQRLAGTAGATSAELDDAAARQSAADMAALALAKQRLSAVIGSDPRVRPNGNDSTLRDLADGKTQLLRATFPLGALRGAAPKTLRATHLDAAPGAIGWELQSVWNAPADANVPGRSFFALLKGADASEGERLLVWAPAGGPAVSGVLVPAAAVVISDSKYWCYTEKKPGTYVRVEADTSRPIAGGYFVTDRVSAGDNIVTAGAGLLLARETNSNSDAD